MADQITNPTNPARSEPNLRSEGLISQTTESDHRSHSRTQKHKLGLGPHAQLPLFWIRLRTFLRKCPSGWLIGWSAIAAVEA
jgi:hypothetical protein